LLPVVQKACESSTELWSFCIALRHEVSPAGKAEVCLALLPRSVEGNATAADCSPRKCAGGTSYSNI